MPFERRKLGRTSLEVSPVGIGGGYGFGGRSIEYAFEQGINYELAKVIEEGPMSPDELAFMREFGDVRHG